jgi:hypothetical protein
MKALSRPALAGLLLVAVAAFLVLIGKGCKDAGPSPASGQAAAGERRVAGESRSFATKRPGTQRRSGDSEPRDAVEFKLLWARGREGELFPALDELATSQDPDDWRVLGDVLVAQASSEGRHEVIDYLLAAGDAAPADLRLALYAAALDNADEAARETARLELQNLTGQSFDSGDAARAWIAAHPEASREPEAEE